jgi:hypothetical protein
MKPKQGSDWLANSVLAREPSQSKVQVYDGLNIIAAVASNDLVANDHAQTGNNSNWSQATYDGVNTYLGNASFKNATFGASIQSDALMPIDYGRAYTVSYVAESSTHVVGAHAYLGLAPYDIDGLAIGDRFIQWLPNTLTTLAADLHVNDTTITLTSSTNWNNAGASFQRAIIVWNYVDGHGKLWPANTYSRNRSPDGTWNAGAISGNTITLVSPWAGFGGGTIPAGTQVSNGSGGGTYMYVAAANVDIPATWTSYSGIVSAGYDPTGQNSSPYQWRPGTTQVKMLLLLNRDVSGNTTNFTNVVLVPNTDNVGSVTPRDKVANIVTANDFI